MDQVTIASAVGRAFLDLLDREAPAAEFELLGQQAHTAAPPAELLAALFETVGDLAALHDLDSVLRPSCTGPGCCSVTEAEHRVRGELLGDLLSAPDRDAESLRARALRLGADLDRPHVLVAAQAGQAPNSRLRAAASHLAALLDYDARHGADLVCTVEA